MEEEIKKLIEENEIIKNYNNYPKEELEILKMYIKLKLAYINKKEKISKGLVIKSCLPETYNYLDYILSCKYKLNTNKVMTIQTTDIMGKQNKCMNCKLENCIKKSVITFIEEIDEYNSKYSKKIEYLDVINYLLGTKEQKFQKTVQNDFFENVNIKDLMQIEIILQAELIRIKEINKEQNKVEFEYIDITNKKNEEVNEYYINLLLKYYKKSQDLPKITIDLENKEEIFNEKNQTLRIYKIAGYYKYLIENDNIDIELKLKQIVSEENEKDGIKIRAHYFIMKIYEDIEKLTVSKKTKNQIYKIVNYILNYRYKLGTPYIPINILIYSNDKKQVEKINKIIGECMWFFGYLKEDMKYYNEYMDKIILDKFKINQLYIDGNKIKNGMLLIHNFENLIYMDSKVQDTVINIVINEIEKYNDLVCTVIYGEKKQINEILQNYPKLSKKLINIEVEQMNVDEIYEKIVKKLEKSLIIEETVKKELYEYIKNTYEQSDIKNSEYIDQLYKSLILNMSNEFIANAELKLTTEDIPKIIEDKNLNEVLKNLNNLVGLKQIKEQVNDLVYLLQYIKKTNINIQDFNMHMVFLGNPGTGKTTIARIITDILYNLGYIKQNKLKEVIAKDLIAEYVGQTAGKTFNVVKSALGGVLFIDEAYSITEGIGNQKLFGDECIATLIKLMEDYKENLIIIFAGYKENMENFLDSNPGLISRIGYKINFENYKIEELTQIYLDLLKKNKLQITDEALEKLVEIIKKSSQYKNFGNGRYIKNIYQKILIEHAKNIKINKQESNIYIIDKEDIKQEKLIIENGKSKIGF